MATINSDHTIVTVEKGDTLWGIASTYGSYITGSGTTAKVETLKNLNGLEADKNNNVLIVVGQKIKLSGSATSTKNTSNKANIKSFGLQSNEADGRTVFATWTWSKSNTENYRTVWYYNTGDGVWFVGSDSTTTYKQSTYSAPANASSVKFKVKPISKKYTDKKSKKEVSYWTAEWSTEQKYYFKNNPPATPSGLTAKIEGYTLTAELDNLDVNGSHIEFQVVKNDLSNFKTAKAEIKKKAAAFSCDVTSGNTYKVRCRAYRESDKVYSDWSEYVDPSGGVAPARPKSIKSIKALTETSVQIDWTDVPSAKTYEIQYTTEMKYFDSSNEVKSEVTNEDDRGHREITGLESGKRYYFRVRSVNEYGESEWSDVVSIIVGKKPSAPTTWSSRTTVTSGEKLYLYWVHNSQDGSSETYADLELILDGLSQGIQSIKKSTAEDEKDRTSVYEIDTSTYSAGTKIQWRVRTRGILNEYGDWSVTRTVDVHAPPTLSVTVLDSSGILPVDPIINYPFYISAKAGPDSQKPVGYHVSIIAQTAYDGFDEFGNKNIVNAGQEIYSRYIDTSEDLFLKMSASDVDLANNNTYKIVVIASMNSGLTATDDWIMDVEWKDMNHVPNADIGVDEENYTASIIPYCLDEDENLVSDVTLAVYRRDFDGGFTEIGKNIPNNRRTTITDPHPSLDYARYRIVATETSTGAVIFYDAPGYPVGAKEVMIQWAEKWSSYDTGIEDTDDEPAYGASVLKLPYNIDVSDSNRPDVALVEYIGREHPVSYYGTQLGESSTWNVVIEKSDINTLYALRRLSKWMGDVYVREPSGSGYWANVTVSFSQKHRDLTIPVTLNITRVAGGM